MSWFAVDRDIFSIDFFEGQKYSERDAWLWMISSAAVSERTINIGGHPVSIDRGQLSFSIRFFAVKFGWEKTKVERFIRRLHEWGFIGVKTATGQTLITISNYDTYQNLPTGSATEARQKRDRSTTKTYNYTSIYNIQQAVWDDFVKLRKAKKAPITDTVMQTIEKEAAKAGWQMDRALTEMCSRGWTGFKAEWVNKEGKTNEKNFGNYGRGVGKSKTQRAKEALLRSAQQLGYADIPVAGGKEGADQHGVSVFSSPEIVRQGA